MYRALRMAQSLGAQTIVVRISLPVALLNRETSNLWQPLVLPLAVAFFVILLLSIWLARSITNPLSDIANSRDIELVVLRGTLYSPSILLERN